MVHSLLYAALMGFVMAAPVGVVGAATALAAMKHRRRDVMALVGGVLLADAVVIGTVNGVLAVVPHFSWADVEQLAWLWWAITVALGGYGVLMLAFPARTTDVLYPENPFRLAVGWTLLANPKNWISTFAAYAGWHVVGMLATVQDQLMVGTAAWAGGAVSWGLWVGLCWHATRWKAQAEVIAQRLVGWLCLGAAASCAFTLLSH